jgi:hypothetical protein
MATSTPDRRRRWFQFGLATLLAVVTIAAIGSSWIAKWLNRPKLIEFDSATYGDPTFIMTVNEIERSANTSKVNVNLKSKGTWSSVGTSMLICKLVCDIAHAHHADYWVKLQEDSDPHGGLTMLIGFTNNPKASIASEFGARFSALDAIENPLRYMRVAEYDELFAMFDTEKPN